MPGRSSRRLAASPVAPLTLGLLAFLAMAPSTSAQVPSTSRTGPIVGPGVELGAKLGLDSESQRAIVGGVVRFVGLIPRVELMGGFDFHFLQNLTERQINGDAVFVFGPGGATYVGGGVVFRNSIYGNVGDPRETKMGGSVVFGLRGGLNQRLRQQIEGRWSKVDNFDSLALSIGVSYLLPLG